MMGRQLVQHLALLFFLQIILSSYVSNVKGANITQAPPGCLLSKLKVDWWSIPPYIYINDKGVMEGIFPKILHDMVFQCCGTFSNISWNEHPSNDSESVKKSIGKNGTIISMPIYGLMKEVKFQEVPFYPVVESPGVVFIVKNSMPGQSSQAVIDAVFQGWPVLLLTLIMAALSGIIIWALDTYWNPEEFPRSFFKGTWEGFWWAFVSMTTVGYGDRAPRSVLARTFAFVWVLIGLVIISIFTATVTTSLTAISLSNEVKLYGSKVAALENTEEQRLGVRNNAKVEIHNSVQDIKAAIIDDKVTGGLLDSYVAGYYSEQHPDQILKDDMLRVGTVLDHQFAYGFVIAGEMNNDYFKGCMRKKLNSMETKITQIIQNEIKTMEESSAALEKTGNLFDADSPIFRKAIFTCIGLVAFLTACGLAWEFFYWRPRQPKEAKTEVERMVTPETSYENLVAQQSTEIEDAMMNEVQKFYFSWNKKLEEIKRRNASPGNIVNEDSVKVMDLGN